MVKQIAVLGSTGSIGCAALQVAKHLKDKINVAVIAAKSNVDLLVKQAKEWHPSLVAIWDKEKAQELKKQLPHCKIVAGMDGLLEAASYESVEQVVCAISGTLGLLPTLAAIDAKKAIALANKEALVSGGAIVTSRAKSAGVPIIPVDSEHSALFQAIGMSCPSTINRLIVTASGGPFRNYPAEKLKAITPGDALKHPTWNMGKKITIDCSTLMNKGLEVIEAHWLFNIPVDKIEVVVHPQSVIHSMVEYIDGSIMAQMSAPSMLVPIQYALTYPERLAGLIPPFSFARYPSLDFFPPDLQRFVCLRLAVEALRKGGSLPCYMNAANEILVDRFLQGAISWTQIGEKLENLMENHQIQYNLTVDSIVAVDSLARAEAACA